MRGFLLLAIALAGAPTGSLAASPRPPGAPSVAAPWSVLPVQQAPDAPGDPAPALPAPDGSPITPPGEAPAPDPLMPEDDGAGPPGERAEPPLPGQPPAAEQRDEDQGSEERQTANLDMLFSRLAKLSNQTAARMVARQIWGLWGDSGSDTVNLLMGWAQKAIGENKNALALDLLDQVTTLAPDYPEGWNRRATLYYAMSDFGRSLSDIERVLELEPRHFGAISGLGVILQRSGQDRRALDAWYRVLGLYPANVQAQKAVSDLEEKLAGRDV